LIRLDQSAVLAKKRPAMADHFSAPRPGKAKKDRVQV
jgi:hypothetical protein